jgi:aspartyl-tRNA(Asn)/glutamyl-tRNA(Gln) amidotransferase subunit A
MTTIAELTSGDLARLYQRRVLSPVEVAQDVMARIAASGAFNAFLPVDAEPVLQAARASQARWQAGVALGPIDGVPATIKDNIWAKGLATRRGSRTTDNTPAPADAPATARLREQGAVILGKTTLPEHGWIGVCHSPLTGITRNPWNLQRTPGGSTGGGAAAALMGLGRLHLGTDGAGSLRIPAAFTGVVGMKPSVGRVAVFPASPLGALSHHGPVTATVREAAQMLSIIAAPDQRDMRGALALAPDFTVGLEDGVRGLRLAWSARFGGSGPLDPEVEALSRRAAQGLAEQGALLEEADPPVDRARDLIRPLWWSAARAIVNSVPEPERETMDPGFLRTAEAGRRYSAADYIAANTARSELYLAMLAFHQRYDLLVSPTMPLAAFEVGCEAPPGGDYGDDWIAWSPYTYPFNLTGQPAASVPCGLTREGLPVGVQIVGPRGTDALVLRAARAIERAMPMPLWSALKGKKFK